MYSDEVSSNEFDSISFLGSHFSDGGGNSADYYLDIRNDRSILIRQMMRDFKNEDIALTDESESYFKESHSVLEALRVRDVFKRKGYKPVVINNDLIFGDIDQSPENRYGFFIALESSSIYKYGSANTIPDQTDEKRFNINFLVFDLVEEDLIGYYFVRDKGYLDLNDFRDIFYSFASTFKYNSPIEPKNLDHLRSWRQDVRVTKKDGSIYVGKIELNFQFQLRITTMFESLEVELHEIQSVIDAETDFQLYPKF